LVAVISGGLYLWADKFVGSEGTVSVAKDLSFEGSDLNAHLQTLRVSNETAYGLTRPSWDILSDAERKEFAKKVYAFAQSKGLKRVNLLNQKGRTVAFVTNDQVELLKPN
jgi:hypothetical protein